MSKVLTNNGLSRVIINIKDLINNHTHKDVTQTSSGMMSAADKAKLDKLDPESVNTVSWKDVNGKPSTFPPSNHGCHIGVHENVSTNILSNFVGELDLNNNKITTFRTNNVISNIPQYGAGIAFRTADTHGYLSMSYSGPNIYAGGGNGNINWSTRLLTANDSCNKNWNWNGQGGQPSWVWGGEDGINMYVYNPAEFTVKCAGYLGSTSNTSSAMYEYGINKWALGAVITGTMTLLGNSVSLGSPRGIWSTVYAGTPEINTSDRNLKDNIISLLDNDIWIKFFMKLNPVSYIFKDGSSGRTHVGFISQDIEDIMNELGMSSLDFAGFCKDLKTETITEEITTINENGEEITSTVTKQVPVLDENGNEQYIYSLRYSEFIAINTHIIQLQQKEIDNINDRLSIIEFKLVNL